MAISRSGSDSRWVTAPRCAIHELGYNLRVPRPGRTQNEEQRRTFLDQLRTWQAEAGLELWFADECGVEGDPRRGGAGALGAAAKVPYLGDHIRATSLGRCVRQWRMLHDDF